MLMAQKAKIEQDKQTVISREIIEIELASIVAKKEHLVAQLNSLVGQEQLCRQFIARLDDNPPDDFAQGMAAHIKANANGVDKS